MVPMGGAALSYGTEHSSDLDLLGEDMWGDLVDEIEYDDPSYSEDSAIVSDIFRQIDDESSLTESPMNAELVGQLDDDYKQKQLSPDINYQSEDTLIWDESEYRLPVSSEQNVSNEPYPFSRKLCTLFGASSSYHCIRKSRSQKAKTKPAFSPSWCLGNKRDRICRRY